MQRLVREDRRADRALSCAGQVADDD